MSFESNMVESFGKVGAEAQMGDPTRGTGVGIEAFRLANGATVAWRCPDTEGSTQDTQVGAMLLRVAAEGAQRIHAVDGDASRTEQWKVEQRAQIAAETSERFEAARADADKAIAAFENADATEAVAPALAAGDLPGALVDHECRTYMRSLDREALLDLAKELGEPKHARLLEAMMRSPVPLPAWIAQSAQAAWIDARLQADPEAARLRRQAGERVNWLRTVAGQASAVVQAMAPTSSAPVIRRQ